MNPVQNSLSYEDILDSLNDGVYVVDTDRRITFWGKSAERITGWSADEVIGKSCADNILCHVDKDGRLLCGEESCPLHRCIVTGQSSVTPIIVFAQGKNGDRIPMRVSVAPIYDKQGQIVGGVESFRDLSKEINDYRKASKIQNLTHHTQLPDDSRLNIKIHFTPHDIVGGDFYTIRQIDDDRYGLLLADVCGHGLSAAMYTMYLSSLWQTHSQMIDTPGRFMQAMNEGFATLLQDYGSFATGIAIMIDLADKQLHLASAGNPSPLLVHPNGEFQRLNYPGLPLGCFPETTYEQTTVPFDHGDHLLLFTDGAVEVTNSDGHELGVDGLIKVLQQAGYPDSNVGFSEIEKQILQYSDRIRFDDDLTFLDIHLL